MQIPQRWVLLVVLTGICATHTEANLEDIWDLLRTSQKDFSGIQDAATGDSRTKMQEGIDKTISQLSGLDKKIDHGVDLILTSMSAQLDEKLPFYIKLQQVLNLIENINTLKNRLFEFNDKSLIFDNRTLEEFASDSVRGHNQIDFKLQELQTLVFDEGPSTSSSLLLLLLARDKRETLCNENQSAQQLLYQFFEKILVTEVSGSLLTSFSYNMLDWLGAENPNDERKISQSHYKNRVLQYIDGFIAALNVTDNEMKRCESDAYRKSGKYLEMGRLTQGYIAYESCFYSEGERGCDFDCSHLNNKSSNSNCGNIAHRKQGQCRGQLNNCKRLAYQYELCPYKSDPQQSLQQVPRFYDHFYTEERKWFRKNELTYYGKVGQSEKCHTKYTKLLQKSTQSTIYQGDLCNYCFCTCDNPYEAVKYISLEEVTSDLASDKVVTGLRFKITNQILHIEIRQGVLTEKLTIKPGTSGWKSSHPTREKSVEIRAVDTKISLCDITTLNHIIAGVKFAFDNNKIFLKVNYATVSPESAHLIELEDPDWHPSRTCAHSELNLKHPDVPFEEESTEFSKSGDYLFFTHSDNIKDGAQHTVPFIDAQEVVPNPESPLSGLGLYHRGQKGYYGFLALKVFTRPLQRNFEVLRAEFENSMNSSKSS